MPHGPEHDHSLSPVQSHTSPYNGGPPRARLSRRVLLARAGAAALAAPAAGALGGVAGLVPAAAAPAVSRSSLSKINNPLVPQRADPFITRHTDGMYYMTASVPAYDRLVLRRSPTIAGLAAAPETVVWTRPSSGTMGGHIWAPEIHHIFGRWCMYFAAGDSDNVFRIRTYVIENTSRNPLTPRWSGPTRIHTTWDTFTLDSTSFEHRGIRYFSWAQSEPGIQTNSNLYLAPMASPSTLAAAPVRLSVPTLPWERLGFRVNEGAAVLIRNGRVFMTYSASATDSRYAMGLLTADEDADLMNPASWVKSQTPVFTTSTVTSMYGPGHNQFIRDEQGRDVLVYHARDYRDIVGDPLYDPNRHARVQRLYWNADGTPAFGIPVGNGPLPVRLEPADQRGSYVYHAGGQVAVGQPARVESSQFRLRDGLAGPGTTSFEPIDAPGQYLRRAAGGVGLAALDGSPVFAVEASFIRRPGLSDSRATSWQAVDDPRNFLRHLHGALSMHRDAGRSDKPSKTFHLD